MKIRLSILDDNDNTLVSTTIDRSMYYQTCIEHGKGVLDDVHKVLTQEYLPNNNQPGFLAFYMHPINENGDDLRLEIKSKIIPSSVTDEFIETFGDRISELNMQRGLTEQEIVDFLNQRTNNSQI